MNNLSNFIRTRVSFSLKEALKRKSLLSAKKANELGSTVQKYKKMLHNLEEEYKNLKKEMAALKKLFVRASKISIRKQLEEAIATFKDTKDMRLKAETTVVQIEYAFGNNPVAKPLLKQAQTLVKEFKALEEEKEKLLSQLTKTHIPVQLTTNNTEFFRPLITYIVQDLHKSDNNADIQIKNSKYIPGITKSKSKQICWARYIPIVDIPTITGEEKNLYLVVTITYTAYGEQQGKLVPLIIEDKRGVEKPAVSQYSIGLTQSIADPLSMAHVLYKVSSLTDAKNVLSFLAYKNKLAVFGEEIEGSVESRLEKVKSKLRIINDPSIKVIPDKNGRNFFLIRIPKSKVDTKFLRNGTLRYPEGGTEWDKNLFLDAQAYAGVSNSSRSSKEIRLVKVTPKNDNVFFRFCVIPSESALSSDPNLVQKDDEDLVLDKNIENELDLSPKVTVEDIREIANQWLKVGK